MRRALGRTAITAAVIGFAAFATRPAAAITLQFDPNPANTYVHITSQTTVVGFGQVQAAIAPGLPTNSFTLNVGQTIPVDFILWTTTRFATAIDTFNVTASLSFLSPPSPPGAGTTGNGSGFGILAGGLIVGGGLIWDPASGVPHSIALGGGNTLTVDFEGGLALILNGTVTTHAFLTLEGPPGGQDLATPLPAALPLFASGLGALGLFGWRRKKKASAFAA
jgi:hypothetical protein